MGMEEVDDWRLSSEEESCCSVITHVGFGSCGVYSRKSSTLALVLRSQSSLANGFCSYALLLCRDGKNLYYIHVLPYWCFDIEAFPSQG